MSLDGSDKPEGVGETSDPEPTRQLLPGESSSGSLKNLWNDLKNPSDPPADPSQENSLPAQIGKYRILSRLGEPSGQAVVYRAWHPELEKEVVIKLGNHAVPPGSPGRDRLVREGRILAQLRHPSLAQLLDLDFHEDRPYLVLEFLRGRNLEQAAGDSRFPPRQAAEITAKTARAIEYLHSMGVLHRDIKPANIILDESGEPRVIDLGLALVRDALRQERLGEGELSGTVAFMSPEQARGDETAERPASDIFSLGGVLYFLLAGKAPFEVSGENLSAALDRARRGDFDASLLQAPPIPSRLAGICLKAMAPLPQERYRSAGELAEDLEAVARGGRRARKAVGAAAVLLAISLLLGGGQEMLAPVIYGLVGYQFGRGDWILEAPPLRTEDSLWLLWRVPRDLEASLFWFDAEGKIHSGVLGKVEETEKFRILRYPAGETKSMRVAGEPGTEVILLCARRGEPLSIEEMEGIIGERTPWPELPERLLLHFDAERVWVERPGAQETGRDTRSPGGETEAPGVVARAEALRKRLLERCEFIRGLAFLHVP